MNAIMKIERKEYLDMKNKIKELERQNVALTETNRKLELEVTNAEKKKKTEKKGE